MIGARARGRARAAPPHTAGRLEVLPPTPCTDVPQDLLVRHPFRGDFEVTRTAPQTGSAESPGEFHLPVDSVLRRIRWLAASPYSASACWGGLPWTDLSRGLAVGRFEGISQRRTDPPRRGANHRDGQPQRELLSRGDPRPSPHGAQLWSDDPLRERRYASVRHWSGPRGPRKDVTLDPEPPERRPR